LVSSAPGCVSSGSQRLTHTQAQCFGDTGLLFPTLGTFEESAPRLWPTPTQGDSKSSGSRNTPASKAHPGISLTDAVRGDGGTGRRSSAAASPARTSATRVSAPESTASAADYGRSSPVLLAKFDRGTRSWRTSQLCLDGDLTEFSETWPRSGMTRSGTAYLLPPLVRLTDVTESGSWPTPTAQVSQRGEGLDTWLARREKLKAKGCNGNGCGTPLTIAVQMWPTPASRDFRHPNAKAYSERGGGTKGEQLPNAVGGALNPTWVEWLMGFPAEWTALDASEMPSSRKSRKSSGEQS
jgi:hypothetical protein